ncbi:MAG: ATP-binding protein [Gemmatimonadota bacterium]|jgi:two-component system phosphate regulon sensor histidine kinase PhoR
MVRFRIHHALFAGFLAVVGLLVILIVVLAGTGLRRELVGIQQAELTRELRLARELLSVQSPSDPQAVVRAITRQLGHRATLIDSAGVVIGDAAIPTDRLDAVENHAGRPEVVESRETGRPAFAERTSATIGQGLLYAAVPATFDGRPVTLRLAAPMEETEATVARSQRAVAYTGLLSLVFALLVAYALSRGLARPLVHLSARAGLLAEGDFGQRAPRNTSVTELDELSVAFNRLAEELQARLAELGRERDEMRALIDTMAEGVIALTDDARILRTNRAARELLRIPAPAEFAPVGSIIRHPELREVLEASVTRATQARELQLGDRHFIVASRMLDKGGAVTTFLDVTEIRRLEQVRRDFVANASHELKTPLTSIRGFAETLLEGEPPPDLRGRFLESIRQNTLRLQRLVDDLLDLSRLESGGWVARIVEVDVADVAESVWRDFGEEAEPRDVAFGVVGQGVAMADRQGLEQIFRNLLENALRYTPSGGAVEVRIVHRDRAVEVEVSDTGIGIPSRALPRIFERFYRTDTSRARDVGGTGLGLSIVRHLVGAMGGDVEAESELGQGTTIRFSLPGAEGAGSATDVRKGA